MCVSIHSDGRREEREIVSEKRERESGFHGLIVQHKDWDERTAQQEDGIQNHSLTQAVRGATTTTEKEKKEVPCITGRSLLLKRETEWT